MPVRRRGRLVVLSVAAAVAVVAALVVAVIAADEVAPQPPPPRSRAITSLRSAPRAAAPRAHAGAASGYLAAAEAAYDRSRDWWDHRRRWYRQVLPGHGRRSLATMWGIVHLFGATNAIAIADPTATHVAAARTFADAAEDYWNPELRPVPGYSPSPGRSGPHLRTWYDDDAWWGVAFFDAFRATGDRQYLTAAARALRYVDSGWDARQGGIYWDSRRTFKSSESLAGAILTAAALYQETHDAHYLALARKYLDWANTVIRARDGLFGGRSTPEGPMAYVEGPIAEALVRLCHATGTQSNCRAGERLMRRTAKHFPVLRQGPQYDAIYLRSGLELYRLDHNPRWYRIAARAGDEAAANARDAHGRYLKLWDGRPVSAIGTPTGKLQTHAATTSVLAWLAAATPPRGTRSASVQLSSRSAG